jgi:hypothetical protein
VEELLSLLKNSRKKSTYHDLDKWSYPHRQLIDIVGSCESLVGEDDRPIVSSMSNDASDCLIYGASSMLLVPIASR